MDFSKPGKPTNNAFIVSFNGRLRKACLNSHWFLSLGDAKSKIEVWPREYNESRRHSSLYWMTPVEYTQKYWETTQNTHAVQVEISI
jgi:putative transposase